MNTSNNQNDITYICPECGGDKCTRVSKDRYRCLYCGATFYVDNPDNQNDTGDDVAKSLQEADEVLQELDEQDKAEKVKWEKSLFGSNRGMIILHLNKTYTISIPVCCCGVGRRDTCIMDYWFDFCTF